MLSVALELFSLLVQAPLPVCAQRESVIYVPHFPLMDSTRGTVIAVLRKLQF